MLIPTLSSDSLLRLVLQYLIDLGATLLYFSVPYINDFVCLPAEVDNFWPLKHSFYPFDGSYPENHSLEYS